jgi:hypothetical protein
MKPETRMTKSETNPNTKIRMAHSQPRDLNFGFRVSYFGFIRA